MGVISITILNEIPKVIKKEKTFLYIEKINPTLNSFSRFAQIWKQMGEIESYILSGTFEIGTKGFVIKLWGIGEEICHFKTTADLVPSFLCQNWKCNYSSNLYDFALKKLLEHKSLKYRKLHFKESLSEGSDHHGAVLSLKLRFGQVSFPNFRLKFIGIISK